MILNPFLEGLIAVLMGAGLIVVSHVYSITELNTYGTLLAGAGAGYVLHAFGNGNGAAPK